ncbi:hypothetical protein BX616_009727 [Lobosporangium transversale]|uniref:Uncharacterized protein n=1 Tax=Lobosporangium transversale TaxID=64571 RepID=A0A1Y2H0T9_9FUNG|nr:hypothetical protein BCR41DRAFT_344752 [Lobosporangium transversale]KAF9918264.1 hypothetical protein BX616_009727 [Lobosporangium transversale]ORZ28169.1 hypothetical protein BCR41DRAFT_344752 [Lobosporangium transversale]|eukprot:XP_021885854.1 hypothetical protein BCR41DRAFT_344752 [Lobosporangium transversale]
MRSSSIIFATAFLAFMAVSNVSAQEVQQPETPAPCYQEKCTPLIEILKECKINVDPTTGDITFPVADDTKNETDKCLCKQSIVNAYDPCYTCGVENQKIQEQFSTTMLVDTCNANFGANTVKLPGSTAASSSIHVSSLVLSAASIVVSVAFLA